MEKRIILPTGQLSIRVENAMIPLEELTGFAARNNPRRGFLFLSKVLGKHLPVRPSIMLRTHQMLAEQVLNRLDETDLPLIVVGMAETATALGQGVFEIFAEQNTPGLYLNTTRYQVNLPRLQFSESHSHASTHFLHIPIERERVDILTRARTLVLVDDEISTGNTFINLIQTLAPSVPQLEKIVIVTLLNWLSSEAKVHLASRIAFPIQFAGLLDGSFTFIPDSHFSFTSSARSETQPLDKDALLPFPGGRKSLTHLYSCPVDQYIEALELPCPEKTGPVLFLGTGEFMYEPYRLARRLEDKGYASFFQATTRSPILLGNDVACLLQFEDNYNEHLDNFIYNVEPGQYDRVFICHETQSIPPGFILPELLCADLIQFS